MNSPATTPATRTTIYAAVDDAAADSYCDAHEGWGPNARFFHSRLHAVSRQLDDVQGGALLEVGCGPGVMVSHLLRTRPGDFTITALDQSKAMICAAQARVGGAPQVEFVVASVEEMPLPSARYDVVLAMGVLEYTDLPRALAEIARVTRPGGLVVVSMLNPHSPYRLVEWLLYWPLVRLLGRLEAMAGIAPENRHARAKTGIQACTVRGLRRSLREAGLVSEGVVHFDVTPTVPPLDRLVRKARRGWREHPDSTLGRGVWKLLGTAYLVASRKPE